MKVGNWSAGSAKYMTATMAQITARIYAITLIDAPPVKPFACDVMAGAIGFLMPGRWRARRTARLVLVGHALLHEGTPGFALQVLVVGPELTGAHLVLL